MFGLSVDGYQPERLQVASVLVQVVPQSSSRVLEEVILPNAEGEIDTVDLSLSFSERNRVLKTDNDRETTSGIVAGFTHIRAKVLVGSVAGLHFHEDFITRHHKNGRAKTLDECGDRIGLPHLPLRTECAIDLDVSVKRLSRHD